MAFKVLTEEQIELLTEEEKARYEKQLKLYREREAFVRQIEAFENMEIPQVQPTLKPVTVISLGEAPEIHTPEIEIKAPQLSVNFQTPKLADYVAPTVPVTNIPVINTAIGEIPDIHIENPQPTIPKVFVPAVPEYHYEAPSPEPISVPDPIRVSVPEMKPIHMEMPEVRVSAPEPVQVQIPEICPYEPQEIVSPQLGSVALPEIDGEKISAKMKEAVQVQKSPEIAVPTVETPKLEAFQVEIAAAPQVSVPTLAVPELRTPETVAVDNPTISVPELPEVPEIRIPEAAAVNHPTISVPELSELPEIRIDRPAVQTAPLAEIVRPEIPTLSFEKPDLTEAPKVTVPSLSEELAGITASLQAAKNTSPVSVELPKIRVDHVKLDEAELAEILKRVQRKE